MRIYCNKHRYVGSYLTYKYTINDQRDCKQRVNIETAPFILVTLILDIVFKRSSQHFID